MSEDDERILPDFSSGRSIPPILSRWSSSNWCSRPDGTVTRIHRRRAESMRETSGWTRQTKRKFEEKPDQSMVSHQLNGIFPTLRLLNLLESERLVDEPFTRVSGGCTSWPT